MTGLARIGLFSIALTASTLVAGGPVANREHPLPPALDAPKPLETHGRIVQLALLLDTSNSMDGLIDQARAELWSVVNDLAGFGQCPCCAERGITCGEPVQLQVALYQYGNDGLEVADGHIQLRVPFTTELDVVSEQLFALTTRGGSEYCGWAIERAAEELAWLPAQPDESKVMRMLVIAGNEPFSQGSVPYTSSIPSLVNKGVAVHTVFCGPSQTGSATFWEAGATLGEGGYCSIDQNHVRMHISTPFDARISELNSNLNSTYVAYGASGARRSLSQSAQDEASGGSIFARAASKATALYQNASWDLVDAVTQDAVEIDSIEKDQLPAPYRDYSEAQLRELVVTKQAERTRIQQEILDASKKRAAFIAESRADEPHATTLGGALIRAIERTALEQGFKVAPESEPADPAE